MTKREGHRPRVKTSDLGELWLRREFGRSVPGAWLAALGAALDALEEFEVVCCDSVMSATCGEYVRLLAEIYERGDFA